MMFIAIAVQHLWQRCVEPKYRDQVSRLPSCMATSWFTGSRSRFAWIPAQTREWRTADRRFWMQQQRAEWFNLTAARLFY